MEFSSDTMETSQQGSSKKGGIRTMPFVIGDCIPYIITLKKILKLAEMMFISWKIT